MDIYFEERYGLLYESVENGRACVWKYEGVEGCVRHQFLMRQIPIELNDGPWYDLITPYGYGGPLIEKISDGYTKEDLIKAFNLEFYKYCKENKIVSEFVRFHPLTDNGVDFCSVYNSELNRYTLGTSLLEDDPVLSEFSKGCRKTIRQVYSKGVEFRMIKAPKNIDTFVSIYYENMQRKEANEFYFFSKEYFDALLSAFRDKLLLAEAIYDEKVIASGLYFLSDGVIHVHLSGTDSEYLSLSPAYVLKHGTVCWGKENGCKIVHYGGGLSSSKEDALFLFKKKFAQKTEFPFYVGKKIWNEEVYDRLCVKKSVKKETEFFPAYRSN